MSELHSGTIIGVQYHPLLSQASALPPQSETPIAPPIPVLCSAQWHSSSASSSCCTYAMLAGACAILPSHVFHTGPLCEKEKNRYSAEAKRQQAHKPSTSGTQTQGHALCNFYAADFCFFVFKKVRKTLAAKNSRNKTAWTQTSELTRQSGASLLPTFWILSGLLSFVHFSILSAGN